MRLSSCDVRVDVCSRPTKLFYKQYSNDGITHTKQVNRERYKATCRAYSGRHTPVTMESTELSRVGSGLRILPKKTVPLAVPESTVTRQTDPTGEPVTVCRTSHALPASTVPREPPIPSPPTTGVRAPSVDAGDPSSDDNERPTNLRKSVHSAAPEARVIPSANVNFQEPRTRHRSARQRSPPASPPNTTFAEISAGPVQSKLTLEGLLCVLSLSICIVHGSHEMPAHYLVPPSKAYVMCTGYNVILRPAFSAHYRSCITLSASVPRLAGTSEEPLQLLGFVKLLVRLSNTFFRRPFVDAGLSGRTTSSRYCL